MCLDMLPMKDTLMAEKSPEGSSHRDDAAEVSLRRYIPRANNEVARERGVESKHCFDWKMLY